MTRVREAGLSHVIAVGIAVTASVALHGCAIQPRHVSIEREVGVRAVIVASPEAVPEQNHTDRLMAALLDESAQPDLLIAHMREAIVMVEYLEAEAGRLSAQASVLSHNRECSVDDLEASGCGATPEETALRNRAGALHTEATALRSRTSEVAKRQARLFRAQERSTSAVRDFGGFLGGIFGGIMLPPNPGMSDVDGSPAKRSREVEAVRDHRLAELDALASRAASPLSKGSSMGDAFIPGPDPAGGAREAGGGRAPGASREAAGSGAPQAGARNRPDRSVEQSAAPSPRPEDTAGAVLLLPNKSGMPSTDATPMPQREAAFVEIDGMVRGSAAVSAPASARSGDTFFVFLRVAPDKLPSLLQSMTQDFPENETVVGDGDIRLTPKMTASVSGTGFKVTSQGELTQVVSATESTTWAWEVEAIKSGLNTLSFTLSGTVMVDGQPAPRNFFHYRQKVDVAVGLWGLVQDKWEWVIGTLILPGLGLLWKSWPWRKLAATSPRPTLGHGLRGRRRVRAAG